MTPLIGRLMRFPRPRNRRAALLSPLAVLASLSLAAGVLGVATPALADPPGAATQVVLSVPGDFVAGVSQTVTLSAEDADGNLDTSYTGQVEVFSPTDPTASYPDTEFVTLAGGTGTLPVELDTAGAQGLIPVPPPPPFGSTAPGVVGVPLAVTVDPGPTASLTVSAPPSVRAAQPFTYVVNQLDAYGNVVTDGDTLNVYPENPSYSGVVLHPTGSGTYPMTFHALASPSHIQVDDGTHPAVAGVIADITVLPPVVATHIQLTIDNSFTVSAGDTTQVTIEAVDDDGNIANVNTPLTVTATDTQAVIDNSVNPAISLVDGVATFPVVFKTAGYDEPTRGLRTGFSR
jgi:hypothetical protein